MVVRITVVLQTNFFFSFTRFTVTDRSKLFADRSGSHKLKEIVDDDRTDVKKEKVVFDHEEPDLPHLYESPEKVLLVEPPEE